MTRRDLLFLAVYAVFLVAAGLCFWAATRRQP